MSASEITQPDFQNLQSVTEHSRGAGRLLQGVGLLGIVGLLASLFLSGPFPAAWIQDYLVHFMFFTTIALGGLFFVFVQHLTRAGWSVTVRRTAELMSGETFTAVAILFLPLAGSFLIPQISLYPWHQADYFAHEPHLAHKAIYLNIPFFIARAAFCLVIWWWLGRFFLRQSVAQDVDGDPSRTLSMERFSPAAALLFTVTVTIASFDWLMSLTPAWYSTIYPVYIFSGCAVGGLAALILLLLLARSAGIISPEYVTVEHLHDLGKLLFGFVIFWGYIAFSQYMLIWYGNIPEETQFYMPRQQGMWLYLSVALIFGHLLIPLVGMMPRAIKRNPVTLGFFAVWLLVFHWIDLYWLVKPTWYAEITPGQLAGGLVGGVAMFLILAGLVFRGLSRYAAVPVKDPRLAEALHHEVA